MSNFRIVALSREPSTVEKLGRLLVETVASGASVSFMHPLAAEDAERFWTKSLSAAEAGDRIVLGAFDDELVGTVTLHLGTPPNQPHRAEIAKLMTLPVARGRGVGSALINEAERRAADLGKWLLTLDSATIDGAGPFYEKLGYIRAGVIPDYALTPAGVLCGTILYYKSLAR